MTNQNPPKLPQPVLRPASAIDFRKPLSSAVQATWKANDPKAPK